MSWDLPAPTITGGCINPSKGRFLHPERNRAVSLLEAARLQTFPIWYRFDLSHGRYPIAEMIGEALPPRFAYKVGKYLKHTLTSRSSK
jgi:DNA (cytosine-5)-methyltransferase 1